MAVPFASSTANSSVGDTFGDAVGLGLGLCGVAAGLVAAAALRGLVASRLTESAASDSRVYLAVSALLLAVAAAATWIPARRALRVDPAHALRAE